MRSTYFATLTEKVAELLNGVLKEEGFTLFRRSVPVAFGPQASASPYALSLTRAVETPENKGTFTTKIEDDRFVVFRSPTRMTASFHLEGKNLSNAERMEALDKITQYFFDNRTIDPILPPDFAASTSLRERMLSAKAELKLVEIQPFTAQAGNDRFLVQFEYCALFHSGNVLREETKAKQRIIDFNDANQRSNS